MLNGTVLQNFSRGGYYGWEFTDAPSAPFHFSFEDFNHSFWNEFIRSNWKQSIYIGLTYVLAIFALQWWMRNKRQFELRLPLFFWNLSLGIFSIIGLSRMWPGFFHVLSKDNGVYQSICVKRYLDIPTTYWSIIFVFSKFVELGDSFFIVLRKRPLAFLQWYHHLVSMNVTWLTSPYLEPVTRWYITMNYGVHSIMYPYLAVRTLGKRCPSWIPILITTLEFAQMVVGFSINLISAYYHASGSGCARDHLSIKLFSLVYGSFLLLFGKYFYDSVIKPWRMKREKLE